MSTQYIIATSGGDYSAYPLRKADFTDWATVAVDLVEEGSTGKYASDVLHRGFGDQWAVFNKTVASGAPAAWTDAVDKIDLGATDGRLNVCRDTPYGVLLPRVTSGYAGDPIQNALNWALKYQNTTDPASRSPAGGPEGCFKPYIPRCGPNEAWFCTGQIFVPNKRGVYLFGEGMHSDSGSAGSNTVGSSRIQFALSDDTKPCIVNQAGGFVMSDLGFFTFAGNDICILNHQIESDQDPYYVANNSEGYGTGSNNTQPCTRMMLHRCDFSGFDIAIQNGGSVDVSNCDHHSLTECYFSECSIGWKNVNDQGVDIKFETIEWRQTNGILFDFQAGGFMKADHILSAYSGSKILNIGLGGANAKGPGKNNGYFKLTDVKTDTRATLGAWVVYMEGTELDRWCHITLDGGMNARRANSGTDDSVNRFCRIVGRTTLTVRDWAYPGVIECVGGDAGGSYAGSTFAPDIVLDRCQLLSADAADPQGRLIDGTVNDFRIIGCSRNTGSTDGTDRPTAIDDIPPRTNEVTITPPAELYRTGIQNMAAVPKANQSYQGTYDCTVAAADAGQAPADCTKARIVLRAGYNQDSDYDKNSTDHSSYVTVPSSGAGTYTIVAADFGSAADKLKAGTNYYVVKEYTFSDGTVQEAKEIERLRFALDQV